MNEAEDFGFDNGGRYAQGMNELHPRAVGAPLPQGNGGRPSHAPEDGRNVPPPGRALPGASQPQGSGVDRAMSVLRLALPFVQRILPVLDGNLGAAVSNMLTHRPAAPPAPPPVNLEPLENSVAELQVQHRDLRTQILEQNTSLKRVEDQLEMVREATDRNTLEQQELLEDLKAVGTKVNMFAVLALILLAGSILLNVVLLLHIQRVLP